MASSPYWILACSGADESKDSIFTVLKSRVHDKKQLCQDVKRWDVPENLKFGSFDALIKLSDDLAKYDGQIESILRRVERQLLDLDPAAEFKILSQRSQLGLDEYINKFQWDDAKFPRTRTIQENLSLLLASLAKLDEEVKLKSQNFADLKQLNAANAKKDQINYIQRDLIEVLHPGVVKKEDFVETNHLTTAVIVVPRGQEGEWLKNYERLCENVVPTSSSRLGVADDKDGNSLWRVVLFRTALAPFKSACRELRFTCRDFEYSAEKYEQAVEQKKHLEAELKKQESFLRKVCQAAFSDTLVAWMHLKAMRVFVEAVLRFGVPPNFAAFMMKPGAAGKEKALRAELLDVFSSSGLFGHSYVTTEKNQNQDQGMGMEGDSEYYPYVSLSFTPLSSKN